MLSSRRSVGRNATNLPVCCSGLQTTRDWSEGFTLDFSDWEARNVLGPMTPAVRLNKREAAENPESSQGGNVTVCRGTPSQ